MKKTPLKLSDIRGLFEQYTKGLLPLNQWYSCS